MRRFVAHLCISNLTKAFGTTHVLRSVNLEIRSGEFVTLLGPSGCGKTTLLRTIAGLEYPDSGDITVDGRSLLSVEARDRDLAMVFQNYALYPHLSVLANIALPLTMRRMTRSQRILARVGLSSKGKAVRQQIDAEARKVAASLEIGHLLDRLPSELSGGQRQRVAMGRAMIRKPRVLLLDEPLSNLDAQLRVQMRTELTALHRESEATFVFVTHDQAEAMTMSDRIAVVLNGKIAQFDTPDALYTDPATLDVAKFVGTPRINELPGVVSEHGSVLVNGRYNIPMPGVEEYVGQTVTVAVRPEHILLSGPTSVGGLPAVVKAVENLGPETLLQLDLSEGSSQVTARLIGQGTPAPRRGENLSLFLDPERLLVFGEDGTRLRFSTARSFAVPVYA